MRKVEINNNKLVKILERRAEILKLAREKQKEVEALQEEQAKLGHKMNKLKEKSKVIMDKMNPELEEFEIITRLFAEDGKAYCEVVNQVEEYKEMIREKNEDSTNK